LDIDLSAFRKKNLIPRKIVRLSEPTSESCVIKIGVRTLADLGKDEGRGFTINMITWDSNIYKALDESVKMVIKDPRGSSPR
jgi:hypothetical protein